MCWLYLANIGTAILDGQLTTVLVDSGARMNVVTPEFVQSRGLVAGSIQDLNNHAGRILINGAGGKRTEPLGYVMIRVQIPNAPSYDEDQVALIIEDPSLFSQHCPVILGTPTIFRAIQAMKESELQRVDMAWQHARAGYEYTHFMVNVGDRIEETDSSFPTNTGRNPVDLDEKLLLKKKHVLLPFSNTMVHCKTQSTQMQGYKLHVMTHAPYPEDKSSLPNGVYVLKTYTELKDGSRNVSVVLRNLTGKTIHLAPGRCMARIAVANEVPEAVPSPELTKELAETQEKETPKLTIGEHQELLMELLRKDGGLEQLKEWPPELALKFERMLMEHHHIFSLDKNEIGCTDSAEHIIELMDDEPFKERFRRIVLPLLEEVQENLQDMLDGGAIRPSKSPWCNAIVLVRKKDGTLRFCIDFRKLNARTKKDSYPLPQMQETMESMVGVRFFSSMDLKSRFWQVRMSEKSQQYTAFTVGSLGVYEFLRMPYGLCNAPATFQRLMQNCLGELNLTYALVYLDDVIVYSNTEEDHLRRLQAVFERFHEHGLKLKPSKCSFLQKQITFLGHEVSAEGMRPGDLNLKGIAEMAPPANYTEVRRFLGMTGFFRQFIKNYARIAKPLNNIHEGEASKLKSEAVTLPPGALEAFETLKMCCMTTPVLAFADFEKEFQLETDASSEGLGAMLLQKQEDGKWHPIAFGSRKLKGGEAKYHSSKLEFLALKWAITEQFREYLQYRPFTVLTDNNPLTYILTTPNLDALGHRWVEALAGYNMSIRYLKGSDNKVADALSRIETRLDPDTVMELLNHAKGTGPRAEIEDIQVIEEEERADQEVILRTIQLARQDKKFRNLHTEDWHRAQLMDPVIPHVLDWLRLPRNNRVKLKDFLRGKVSEADCRAYGLREKDFEKRDHLLFIKTTPPENVGTIPVFVVPVNRRQVAIDMCHRNAGHQGRDRTLSLLKGRFW